MMRVLLTGSSGWLGRFLAPRLRAAGHVVIGLDVAPGADTQIIGSVADRTVVERVFSDHGIQAVIHAGALLKPDIVRVPAQDFVEVNVTGTRNLLQAAVSEGLGRFVFTSTTSLMISKAIRQQATPAAVWLNENSGPLAPRNISPRNIYGLTKLAPEQVCLRHHHEKGLNCVVLRTARFFPEEDDTQHDLPGPNLKANEFLSRRLTVEDAAEAHIVALERAPEIGFGTFIISAPTPFAMSDVQTLKRDAAAVVRRYFPDAPALYAQRGWRLPASIGRVYDATLAERVLGFRCATGFSRVLDALRTGRSLPFAHDPGYEVTT